MPDLYPAAKRTNAAMHAHIEGLEQRQLLAVSIYEGYLDVMGTATADTIMISLDADDRNTLVIDMTDGNGVSTQDRFSIRQLTLDVKAFYIAGGAGADYIQIDESNGKIGFAFYMEGHGRVSQVGADDLANDTLIGGSGHDLILAGGGDDVIYGAAGDDRLDGGDGNDFLDGGGGGDYIYGRAGEDWINGKSGNDYIEGGADDDNIAGGRGADEIYGNDGDDFLAGDDQADTLDGGMGSDQVWGGGGSDLIYGGDGDDQLIGQSGNDWIFGGRGNDLLKGGSGKDRLDGGIGVDSLLGGGGCDVFNIDKNSTRGEAKDQSLFDDRFGNVWKIKPY